MPVPHDPLPDERERRIEALRTLARQSEQRADTPPESPPAIPQRPVGARYPRRGVLLAAISAIVLIAVAGGLVARVFNGSMRTSRQRQPSTTYTIAPAGLFTCAKDIAWSPDNTMIAFLGYQRNCANSSPDYYSYHAGDVLLYDATTGKEQGELRPDPIITAALHLKPPTIATPPAYPPGEQNTSQQAIDFARVIWSPDSKRLAVTFSVLLTTGELARGNFATTSVQGVLLSDLAGTQTQVLSRTLTASERYSGLWNLTTSAYVPPGGVPPKLDAASIGWYASPALIPPALQYQWDSTGHLQPNAPLNATSAPAHEPSTPVGQPDGSAMFSIWQPGTAQLITRVFSSDAPHTPIHLKTPVETWQTALAAWSADGRFLFAGDVGMNVSGWRLSVAGKPTPDAATLAMVGLTGAPVLPTRDAGLAAALQRFHDLSLNPNAGFTSVNLAWSPDGKRLAVEAPVPDITGQKLPTVNDFAVSIYDCATGKRLGSLIPTMTLSGGAAGNQSEMTYLRWSPNGTRLLFYDPSLSGAQIWGPDQLPR